MTLTQSVAHLRAQQTRCRSPVHPVPPWLATLPQRQLIVSGHSWKLCPKAGASPELTLHTGLLSQLHPVCPPMQKQKKGRFGSNTVSRELQILSPLFLYFSDLFHPYTYTHTHTYINIFFKKIKKVWRKAGEISPRKCVSCPGMEPGCSFPCLPMSQTLQHAWALSSDCISTPWGGWLLHHSITEQTSAADGL